jgi:hypothetical protein
LRRLRIPLSSVASPEVPACCFGSTRLRADRRTPLRADDKRHQRGPETRQHRFPHCRMRRRSDHSSGSEIGLRCGCWHLPGAPPARSHCTGAPTASDADKARSRLDPPRSRNEAFHGVSPVLQRAALRSPRRHRSLPNNGPDCVVAALGDDVPVLCINRHHTIAALGARISFHIRYGTSSSDFRPAREARGA